MPSGGMTFDTLKTLVGNYLERALDATTDPLVYETLPTLINFAERRIARDLKIQGMQQTTVSNFVSGTSVYAKPDRWRETISINWGNGTGNRTRNFIYPRAYEYLRMFWPDADETGTPRFYADYDAQHWLISPTPSANSPFEVLYWQLPPLLDDDTQQNWLTEYLPEVLTYASCFETAVFVKNEGEVAKFKGLYDEARGSVSNEDMQKIIDRTTDRKAGK